MKKIKMFSVAAALGGILLATGCASTQIDRPGEDPDSGIRSERTIGSEELRQVAEVAAKDALVFPKFTRYVAEYAAAHNNEKPTLKLARTVNDTNDPDLNTREMTDMIERVLLMADVVEVTRAEGSARAAAIRWRWPTSRKGVSCGFTPSSWASPRNAVPWAGNRRLAHVRRDW